MRLDVYFYCSLNVFAFFNSLVLNEYEKIESDLDCTTKMCNTFKLSFAKIIYFKIDGNYKWQVRLEKGVA